MNSGIRFFSPFVKHYLILFSTCFSLHRMAMLCADRQSRNYRYWLTHSPINNTIKAWRKTIWNRLRCSRRRDHNRLACNQDTD